MHIHCSFDGYNSNLPAAKGLYVICRKLDSLQLPVPFNIELQPTETTGSGNDHAVIIHMDAGALVSA